MKRLIKKAQDVYNSGDRVRFINNNEFYEIVQVDVRDNTYILRKDEEVIENVNFTDIVLEGEYIVGDQVLFESHPYNNTLVFEVKEVLADGTYFIESGEIAFTGINGTNLELIL